MAGRPKFKTPISNKTVSAYLLQGQRAWLDEQAETISAYVRRLIQEDQERNEPAPWPKRERDRCKDRITVILFEGQYEWIGSRKEKPSQYIRRLIEQDIERSGRWQPE